MKPTGSLALCAVLSGVLLPSVSLSAQQAITGSAAYAGWSQQKPGVMRKITSADLPAPFASESVDNGPDLINRPKDAWPIAPAGFKVELYAGGDAVTPMQRSDDIRKTYGPTSGTFVMPRVIHTAPNGDLFVADSQAGSIFVLRGVTPDGKAVTVSEFATGLDHPFGIAFYPAGPNPKYMYVGTATEIVRFPYKSGELKAETNTPQTIVPDIPGYAQLRGGGHWTRDVVFSADGKYMLVSVGSRSNIDDPDRCGLGDSGLSVGPMTPVSKFRDFFWLGIAAPRSETLSCLRSDAAVSRGTGVSYLADGVHSSQAGESHVTQDNNERTDRNL
jgi:glucose/arabinose dehydrogenase